MAHIHDGTSSDSLTKELDGDFLVEFRRALMEQIQGMEYGLGRTLMEEIAARVGQLGEVELAEVAKSVAGCYRSARRQQLLIKAAKADDFDLRVGYTQLAAQFRPTS